MLYLLVFCALFQSINKRRSEKHNYYIIRWTVSFSFLICSLKHFVWKYHGSGPCFRFSVVTDWLLLCYCRLVSFHFSFIMESSRHSILCIRNRGTEKMRQISNVYTIKCRLWMISLKWLRVCVRACVRALHGTVAFSDSNGFYLIWIFTYHL